jgi:hypothetical protein
MGEGGRKEGKHIEEKEEEFKQGFERCLSLQQEERRKKKYFIKV